MEEVGTSGFIAFIFEVDGWIMQEDGGGVDEEDFFELAEEGGERSMGLVVLVGL